MFENIGAKIKKSAKSWGRYFVLLGFILGAINLYYFFDEDFALEYLLYALLYISGGFFLLEITRLFFGFGQLIEDVHAIRCSDKNVEIADSTNEILEEIEKYKNLFEQGIITEEEYLAKKEQLSEKL
ncbi:MAG: SHOCT domain-containing protein [Ruminococcaceae bacterium]|nr:SHOCT domain-containing protein [Oscillospiraceae bacterium]MBQ7120050.1 SHOCT domain-containing protein [Oscillospiraceae bacterium]